MNFQDGFDGVTIDLKPETVDAGVERRPSGGRMALALPVLLGLVAAEAWLLLGSARPVPSTGTGIEPAAAVEPSAPAASKENTALAGGAAPPNAASPGDEHLPRDSAEAGTRPAPGSSKRSDWSPVSHLGRADKAEASPRTVVNDLPYGPKTAPAENADTAAASRRRDFGSPQANISEALQILKSVP